MHELLVSDRSHSVLVRIRLDMIIVAASGLPCHSFPLWYSIHLDFYVRYELVSSATLHKAVQSFHFIDQLKDWYVTQRPHFISVRKVIELPEQPKKSILKRRLSFRKEHISANKAV